MCSKEIITFLKLFDNSMHLFIVARSEIVSKIPTSHFFIFFSKSICSEKTMIFLSLPNTLHTSIIPAILFSVAAKIIPTLFDNVSMISFWLGSIIIESKPELITTGNTVLISFSSNSRASYHISFLFFIICSPFVLLIKNN